MAQRGVLAGWERGIVKAGGWGLLWLRRPAAGQGAPSQGRQGYRLGGLRLKVSPQMRGTAKVQRRWGRMGARGQGAGRAGWVRGGRVGDRGRPSGVRPHGAGAAAYLVFRPSKQSHGPMIYSPRTDLIQLSLFFGYAHFVVDGAHASRRAASKLGSSSVALHNETCHVSETSRKSAGSDMECHVGIRYLFH